jgi:hypothetical protein
MIRVFRISATPSFSLLVLAVVLLALGGGWFAAIPAALGVWGLYDTRRHHGSHTAPRVEPPWAELKRRVVALIDHLGPRLVANADSVPGYGNMQERVQGWRSDAESGEEGIAMSALCGELYELGVLLDADEIREIEALAPSAGLEDREWAFVRELKHD